jgi:hypothetical protein
MRIVPRREGEGLGYPVERVKDLRNLEELKMVKGRDATVEQVKRASGRLGISSNETR